MPRDPAKLTPRVTPDVERVDISMLSETQRDMLWMRLRGHDVPYVFDGATVTVPLMLAALLADAIIWVKTEVWSPPRGYYPEVHPFQRLAGRGVVIAPRWRRLTAACIDRALLGMLIATAHRQGAPAWLLWSMSALYTIGPTRRWGRTIGKFLMEIRVVDANGSGRLTWQQSTARWAIVAWMGIVAGWVGGADKFLLAAQLCIFVPALFDSRGRGLHDRLAGTMVISIR
ncbi:MAG: hypothetical protein QOC57_2216 [Ilumatobacteraceae bacterium]